MGVGGGGVAVGTGVEVGSRVGVGVAGGGVLVGDGGGVAMAGNTVGSDRSASPWQASNRIPRMSDATRTVFLPVSMAAFYIGWQYLAAPKL